ncbi:PhoX family protein [Ideonella livida]|uniref:PhoX family phosphatase n=1 Tax=Ideonella livida TaxID=2707176 RepID=A0A7C9PER4_9BURK|nr:PhoX family phosphatase [Ideonella livida]NDY90053.1 PhoX family phosphatase [Ideonella livida]
MSQLPPVPHAVDPDDIGHNDSANPHFQSILETRLSRRGVLMSGLGAASAVVVGSAVATPAEAATSTGSAVTSLGFHSVDKTLADVVTVPAGYTARVIYALGDPLDANTPEYQNDGSDTSFETRAGDHHDGMDYFGLSAAGTRDDQSSARALLAMNHEAITDHFLHVNGATARPRPAAESDKEIAAHGVSIVEVHRGALGAGRFRTRQSSRFNRRITPHTPARLSGPAAGSALTKTLYSPTGTHCRGTVNNCGTGRTPWGTLMTGEENWAGYFTRGAGDDTARADKSVAALVRYGRAAGGASRHGWETSGTDDKYRRFDISRTGASADGSDDYRNELNTFGYLVEIDPYDPKSMPVKRTAMGRFAHESAAFSLLTPGLPLAVYMGDDSRNEYFYKYVSNAVWDAADAQAANRLAAGAKYLDSGRLYVAKFNADGTGTWIELSLSNPLIANYAGYAFADQADVVVNARLAADAVGATKMDRPEWSATHPVTGEVYFTLTNNSNRKVTPTSSSHSQVDAANPRSYSDSYAGGAAGSPGNVNGHILRLREDALNPGAQSFAWDVYVFGAQADADPSLINLSNLTAERDFSSPDGLWFSQATGICWIQTDDGAYTDTSNCMMLAAVPGRVGDGSVKTLNHGSVVVNTPVGKAPTHAKLRRFLVGPKDCEITGCCETPDGRALFVNIQHPGESISASAIGTPGAYVSHWPGNAGYGNGGALARPRSATIVITKKDGGLIGT